MDDGVFNLLGELQVELGMMSAAENVLKLIDRLPDSYDYLVTFTSRAFRNTCTTARERSLTTTWPN